MVGRRCVSQIHEITQRTGSFSETTTGKKPKNLRKYLGTNEYYQQRQADFRTRFPNMPEPPYYRLAHDYNLMFEDLRRDLSPAGKVWADAVEMRLQSELETMAGQQPNEFIQLELDQDKMASFVKESHRNAYFDEGLMDLPWSDRFKIARTIVSGP